MTNADNIRQMSDEELAKMFDDLEVCRNPLPLCIGFDCKECWLEWLKNEVNNDEKN